MNDADDTAVSADNAPGSDRFRKDLMVGFAGFERALSRARRAVEEQVWELRRVRHLAQPRIEALVQRQLVQVGRAVLIQP